MSELFDPYHRWLGIRPSEQPADHYRLLGVSRDEDDPEVIRDAAERQIRHVRSYELGEHAGSITVVQGGVVALEEVCDGDLLVEQGGKTNVNGIIGGNVINRGGQIVIHGIVGGDVITESGRTLIMKGSIVNGQRLQTTTVIE